MRKAKRIILVGGGSGGHFYPLIAVAEAIKAQATRTAALAPELYYMGPDPYNADELAKHAITFVKCAAGKRRKYRSLLNILDFFKTLWGIIQAFWKLFMLYPDAIVSKGGYTSVPVVIAGWLLRIPILIHESDVVPGTANKIALQFARYIAISYPEAAVYFPTEKTALTGIPMRSAITEPRHEGVFEELGIDPQLPLILILGGSQGAERVNELILDTLDELLPEYTIIHQTGVSHFAVVVESAKAVIPDRDLLKRYHPVQFLDAPILNQAMHAAAVIVSRAGSGTIHEIAAHQKPAILVPIPEDISHDQRKNAYAYAHTGAASVLEEHNLRDGLLAAEITRIMSDQNVYNTMASAAGAFAITDAAERIATTIIGITEEHA